MKRKYYYLKHLPCGYSWISSLGRLPVSCPKCKRHLKESEVEMKELKVV